VIFAIADVAFASRKEAGGGDDHSCKSEIPSITGRPERPNTGEDSMSRSRMFRTVPMLAATVVLFVAGSAMAHAAAKAHPAAGTITAALSEYKIKLSVSSLEKPGSVTFKVTNVGHIRHDFSINKKTTKLLAPGQSTTLTVKFAKKGSYYYECTVPGHAALGMKGYFKVL
jgi:plastocyanin